MNINAIAIKLAAGLLLALAAGTWTLGQAQDVLDYSGQWDMTTDVTPPGEVKRCNYVGTAQVVHDLGQGTLSGIAQLELVAGPAVCPAEMAAEISGNPKGIMIFNGLLFGGIWGEATFTGGVQGKLVKGMLALGGGLEVIVGPFAGATGGGWAAVVSDGVFKDSFETLIVLSGGTSLLVLAAAGMLIRRRRRV